MHDIKYIRDNPAAFDAARARRGLEPVSPRILELDAARRAVQTRMQEAQSRRNTVSKEIGAARAKKDEATANALMAEMAELKERMPALEREETELAKQLDDFLSALPNLPAEDVPEGRDETANREIRRHGVPKVFGFAPREHFELGEALGMMDFERAARISGARFVVLKGALARLERALGQFMLDLHTTEFGYTEAQPPILVRDQAAYGTGQLPKFSEDLFHTDNGFWLIPTAELPLTNLVREELIDERQLPMRLTALTPCFRSEAGAAGKDTRGMIRQHQFNKVELVSITTPEQSAAEHERMTGCAEEVLKRLGLPYRAMLLCAGDMGFSAAKTYDLEVWLPGQNQYREISSCSNCGDFQARRMNARVRAREADGKKGVNRPVHTLNGSGVAVGRALIAVMENYQEADGSISVPEALKSYMGGMARIARNGE